MPAPTTLRPQFCVFLLTLGSLGCEGVLGEPSGPGDPSLQSGPSAGPGLESAAGSGDFASGSFDASQCSGRELHPGAMPGLVRLTHRQYDNAVRDLLGIESGALTDFLSDQSFFGFDNNAENLSVPQNQVLRYQATAEQIAQQVAADLSHVASSAPCVMGTRDAACRDGFLQGLLKRMFRRPLGDAELTRYRTLFDGAKDLYPDGDEFSRGVRLVLEAALQSPSFLYRQELRDGPLDGRVVALDDYEIASRLALTLWASVPDAALMQKADAGSLNTDAQIEAEARRMLSDPKAARVLDDFHTQWLELEKLRFTKDAASFPGYDEAAFARAAKQEALSFARFIGLESGGTIADLFTKPVSFVDRTLASIYGLTGVSGDAPTRVDLDPTQRAGLFTQLGFLAGHADSVDSSPIHRGAYIQKRVLCTVFGSLPGNVGTLPARGGEIVTTRDQVEAKTEPPQCQACHARINPAGFAFETFDSIGRVRSTDHGAPVDASGTLAIDGKDVSFNGPLELSKALAESGTAKRCYETQWFRYSYGRGEQNDDVCLLNEIDQRAQAKGYGVKELLVAMTLSRGFRFRAQEDL